MSHTGQKAILDTSVLLCLYHLKLLKYLNLLFSEVRLPVAVEKEFLNKNPNEQVRSERFSFITGFLSENDGWFLKCNEYGKDLIELYKMEKGIDEGEAEALAQNQYYDAAYCLLLDEKTARKVAKSRAFAVHGVLYVLARMDVKLGVCDYRLCVERLRNELGTRLDPKIVDLAYKEAEM